MGYGARMMTITIIGLIILVLLTGLRLKWLEEDQEEQNKRVSEIERKLKNLI